MPDATTWVMLIAISFQGETASKIVPGFKTQTECEKAAKAPLLINTHGAEITAWCIPGPR